MLIYQRVGDFQQGLSWRSCKTQDAAVPSWELQMASAARINALEETDFLRENLGSVPTEDLPGLVNIQKTMENHHVSWVNPL